MNSCDSMSTQNCKKLENTTLVSKAVVTILCDLYRKLKVNWRHLFDMIHVQVEFFMVPIVLCLAVIFLKYVLPNTQSQFSKCCTSRQIFQHKGNAFI